LWQYIGYIAGMKILSIETSCDETAVSIVEATGEFPTAAYEILGNSLWSQIDIHREYGGVFPAIAKREHAATIVSMLEKALEEANLLETAQSEVPDATQKSITQILEREPGLAEQLLAFAKTHESIELDLIAVTAGPGLEPALWVGVNFARALALLWNTPIVPVNHMEGHILSSIFDADKDDQLADISFPSLSLLISGGHTELVLLKDWGQYEKIGQTRDDAVGEAYDKVARLLGLPYPGGPEIAARAKLARQNKLPQFAALPSPMLHSGDLDMSFSGLKTAVRYTIQERELSETDKQAVARDFEDAVTQVLLKKTHDAVTQTGAETLIVGGGVSANQHLRNSFNTYFLQHEPELAIYFPQPKLATDNSVMIALAGHAKMAGALAPNASDMLRADGNKSL
jgi:N6-L-threonylcarbamoyladenine synthase